MDSRCCLTSISRKPIKAGERISDRLGGTPGWMAPEQEAALKAVGLGQPVPAPVDHRGIFMHWGSCCAKLSAAGAGGGDVAGKLRHRRNPEISVGLTDITLKCLARSLPTVIATQLPWRMTYGDT